MNAISKKIVYSKPQGQALLIVLVISTLTLMLLMGIATRINLGETNVRRSSEFDASVAATDAALTEIIKSVKKNTCVFTATDQYTRITSCTGIPDNVEVYVRSPQDARFVDVTPSSGSSLYTGQDSTGTTKVRATGVRIKCDQTGATDAQLQTFKFVVSRVYQVGDSYVIDKGVIDCRQAKYDDSAWGNVTFYTMNGVEMGKTQVLEDLKLVRVRMLDGANSSRKVETTVVNCTSASACNEVTSTGRNDFVVIGEGGLGSDSIVKFELPKGLTDQTVPAFDFVYFGEDIN